MTIDDAFELVKKNKATLRIHDGMAKLESPYTVLKYDLCAASTEDICKMVTRVLDNGKTT